jgi:hypothetical protein
MTIIFDIDGVLADNSHRTHFIKGETKHWDMYYDAMGADPVIQATADILADMTLTHHVVLCTGRPEKYRERTMQWLQGANLDELIDHMYMRPDGDFRPNPVIKEWQARCVMDRFGPIGMVFEDDERSVKEWLRYSPVVFHVKGKGYNG